MELPRLENVDLSGKRVFLRVDFNVPLENGKVTDKTRIEKTLPTIELLIQKKRESSLQVTWEDPRDKRIRNFLWLLSLKL